MALDITYGIKNNVLLISCSHSNRSYTLVSVFAQSRNLEVKTESALDDKLAQSLMTKIYLQNSNVKRVVYVADVNLETEKKEDVSDKNEKLLSVFTKHPHIDVHQVLYSGTPKAIINGQKAYEGNDKVTVIDPPHKKMFSLFDSFVAEEQKKQINRQAHGDEDYSIDEISGDRVDTIPDEHDERLATIPDEEPNLVNIFKDFKNQFNQKNNDQDDNQSSIRPG